MDELFAVLLSWAVTLSGYQIPSEEPEVVAVPHQFFVDNACNGRECRVYGWYAGGRKLYIDERMDPKGDTLAASVVVHEMVHFLQGMSRGTPDHLKGAAFGEHPSCRDSIELEREAYAAQREFLLRNGVYRVIGTSMLRVGCDSE